MLRFASTVMLARPGSSVPFELFMLRRSANARFAPDVYVFPGGTVEVEDANPKVRERLAGAGEEHLRKLFRATAPPETLYELKELGSETRRSLVVAALRELYEEAGVLLAVDRDTQPLSRKRISEMENQLASHRDALARKQLTFGDLLTNLDVFADARALRLFSHWITPPSEPHRYSAYFFLATVRGDQPARADAVETHDGTWVAPQTALQQFRSGSFGMVYPTIKHIERLAAFGSLSELEEFARHKTIVSVMPEPDAGSFRLPAELEQAW